MGQSPKDVAVDTQRGGIFEPHNCADNKPAICRSGLIYNRGRLLCTRGILDGDVTQRARCFDERNCAFNDNDIKLVPNSTRADWLEVKNTNESCKPIGMISESEIPLQIFFFLATPTQSSNANF